MVGKAHNERCHDCKQTVKDMLAALFGQVEVNWDLDLPCQLDEFKNNSNFDTLNAIYVALQKHRGYEHFILGHKLPRVDYFIPGQNLIIEYDESQHFTKPRDLTLSQYPSNLHCGFSVLKWRELCQKLNRSDIDPPFRDEQRAWYDTLRDFAPQFLGKGRTLRLYSRELIWCCLNPKDENDLQIFKKFIRNRRGVR